jgi:GlpG protein
LRQIGTLPKGNDPKVFADYLLTLGIKTRIDEQSDGWLLWIYDEDRIPQARDELQGYLTRPDDARYQSAVDAALAIRRQQQELDKQFRKNYREVSDLWAYPGLRRRPLTLALVALCIVVFLLESQNGNRMKQHLWFATLRLEQGQFRDNGLSDILGGEVWRLVTPIFMHVNILHIFFNMWWLLDLGTMIEVRRGTLRLAMLILISAVISNFGQYIWMERTDPGEPHLFEGMSGVIYALFGYIWMKGLYQPEQGMALHPNTITIMLLWLVLCMTGTIGPIGNAAHFMGLVVGVACGVLRF